MPEEAASVVIGESSWRVVAVASFATCVAVCALGFGSSVEYASWAFEHTTYWFMWASVALPLSVLHAMHARGELSSSSWRFWGAACGLAGVSTAFLHFGVGSHYRILSDETNLLSTSLSFYLHRTASNITEALAYGGGYHVVSVGPPSRPCLYPFLVSLLHSPFGYHAEHGFVVSGAAAFGTLVLVAALGRRLVSARFGLLAAAIVGSTPLFQLSATSCGFESLNLFFVVAVLSQMLAFLERPTMLRAELLVGCCVLGAHCRYETAVLLAPAAAACALRARTLLAAKWSARIPIYPLLLLPLLFQRRITSVINDARDGVSSPFALKFVPGHLRALGQLLGASEVRYPAFQLVALLAVVGLALFLARSRRAWRVRDGRFAALALVATGMALVALVQAAFYLGDFRLAFQARFATSYVAVLGMLAAYPLDLAMARFPSSRVAVGALVSCLVVCGLGISRANDLGRSLNAFRVYAWELAVVGDYARDSTLVVGDSPGRFTAQFFGAVTFDYAARHGGELAKGLDRHRWEDVLVLREAPCAAEAEGLALEGDYEQTLAGQYQIDADSCAKVVRVRKGPGAVVKPDERVASTSAD